MTEVVYRLYETVDELSTVIENARSVLPMSSSCVVPRDHLLDLLDDLRESLPEEVQAAGSIVEQRTEILQAAQAEAERLSGRIRDEAEQLLSSAHRQRDETLGTARRQRDELITAAQREAGELLASGEQEAARLVEEARRHRETLLAEGRAEHERLVAEGRAEHERLVAEGRAEHERLVAETEVYQRALAQADDLGASTRTEVARMRAEVDEYVDTRLADFGSTLERMLRSVEKARSALREP